ncbi:MAG: methylenetetrahydrofolate reductase [NAD(P)H] [candidate division KSB1 bacterium]|nr:methylenetetrahydrofolate reductase [NAD(P)H] [candidate division KSB1 bacterium]
MKVKDLLDQTPTTFSFEFFPPKSEDGWENLFNNISKLLPLKPSYVSVTYGAGGSTRHRTHELVVRIHKELGLTVVPHLTCVGSTKDEIAKIMERYQKEGIENVLALRGDAPDDNEKWTKTEGGFEYACELVAFIRKNFPDFCIGVAGFPEGHPETPNRLVELDHLKAKVDAGADYIVTQFFFANQDFYDYQERCSLAGIEAPIIAGIMPIISTQGMHRMSELAAGSRIPAPLYRLITRAVNEEYVEHAGVHWASEQVRDLVENQVRGIHFYTLNRSNATLRIYQSLGVKNSKQFLET